jgi:hypothetical protein
MWPVYTYVAELNVLNRLQLCGVVSIAAGLADADVASRFTRSPTSVGIRDDMKRTGIFALFLQPLQPYPESVVSSVTRQSLTGNAWQVS